MERVWDQWSWALLQRPDFWLAPVVDIYMEVHVVGSGELGSVAETWLLADVHIKYTRCTRKPRALGLVAET